MIDEQLFSHLANGMECVQINQTTGSYDESNIKSLFLELCRCGTLGRPLPSHIHQLVGAFAFLSTNGPTAAIRESSEMTSSNAATSPGAGCESWSER
jgi:hypothetical protein